MIEDAGVMDRHDNFRVVPRLSSRPSMRDISGFPARPHRLVTDARAPGQRIERPAVLASQE